MATITTTLGFIELGGMVMILLYGIMVAQAYTYYKSSYSGDHGVIHVLVSERLLCLHLALHH